MQKIILDVYNKKDKLVVVCENMLDMDQLIQSWRYGHIKLVERTIGNKKGTGGSDGIKYLSSTLSRPFFIDLWEIRDKL